jgi:hypothetical protein
MIQRIKRRLSDSCRTLLTFIDIRSVIAIRMHQISKKRQNAAWCWRLHGRAVHGDRAHLRQSSNVPERISPKECHGGFRFKPSFSDRHRQTRQDTKC